jgi:predicted nucleic-acid-binding protein
MIGVDTSLLARLILDDDPGQAAIVNRMHDAAGTGGIYVSLVVVAELAWLLKRGYQKRPETVLAMIGDLLAAREYTVQQPDLVQAAIDDARKAKCGLADAIIARMNRAAGAEATLTFDIPAKRLPTMRDAATNQ